MSDIRRHGFESDAQWREYLAEIEDATSDAAALNDDRRTLRALAGLRAEVAALRERIQARSRQTERARPWRIAGAGLFLLLLLAAGR